jgi:hypothetical protein
MNQMVSLLPSGTANVSEKLALSTGGEVTLVSCTSGPL